MEKVKTELLTNAGKALYGERWQTDLARALGLPDGRRVRQWLSLDRPIPEDAWGDIALLLKSREIAIRDSLVAVQMHRKTR